MADPIQMQRVGTPKLRDVSQTQTGDVVQKSKDTNPPQNPTVHRAFCFDHITDPTTHVVPTPPPPVPNPPPRRDPFLMELGNIELGSKIQIISLSDNPAANFKDGAVFELEFTGYDANARRGTVLLSAAEMEKKQISPGERLVIRVVDDNGNASDGVFVHVDPSKWAGGGQINTKDDTGAAVRLQGAPIQFVDGFVAPGVDVAAHTKSTFGATMTDMSAPKLMTEGVSVKTLSWSKNEQEMFESLGKTAHFNNGTVDAGVAWCQTPGNLESVPLEHRGSVAEMAKDGGKLLLKMLESQNPLLSQDELKKLPITQAMFQQMGTTVAAALKDNGGVETMLLFRNALEPGVRLTAQNNSLGTTLNGAQNDQTRSSVVRLHVRDGDKVTVQFTDGNGVRGDPYAFEYDSAAKNGKKAEKGGFKNPLQFQLAARTVKLNGET